MELLGNVGLLATVLGVIGLLGGAAGYFKASRGDSIIKYQTIELDLRDKKIASLEREKLRAESDTKAMAASCEAKDETIAEKDKQIDYLQRMSQGSPQLKQLTRAVENQTKLISEYFKREERNNAA